jgi:phosphatidylinositol glycan class S
MGLESTRLWEIDFVKRLRTFENTVGSVETLVALSELLGEIGNLVIRDEIGEEIREAVDSVNAVDTLLMSQDLNAAFGESVEAHESSDKAFFDESLLELLYFPDDQK